MPIRMLRDWTDSVPVNSISRQAEVLFVRLIMKADDFGRFYASPKLLRSLLFPLLIDSVRDADCSRWIAECEKAGLVRVYQSDGKEFLEIVNFGQRLRTSRQKFPAPTTQIAADNCQQVAASRGRSPPEYEVETETECETELKPNTETLPEVAELWNSVVGVVHVRDMTKKRRDALRNRLADDSWAGRWKEAIERVSCSDFCKGGGSTGWKADFDWFLKPDTLVMILEGKYDNRPINNRPGTRDVSGGHGANFAEGATPRGGKDPNF